MIPGPLLKITGTITAEPRLGSSVDDVIAEAIAIADKHRCTVQFKFNGTQMEAKPGDTAVVLHNRFWGTRK